MAISMTMHSSIFAGMAMAIVKFGSKDTIFTQGNACKDVMYIQEGTVKLSVVSTVGKEAVLAMLKPGDFVGEGALTGQPARTPTATAVTPATLLVIGLKEMVRVLHSEHTLFDGFLNYLLERSIRIEEELIEQLFNSSEKRLARTLVIARPLWEIGEDPINRSQRVSRNVGANDRHHTVTRQFLHEQV